MDRRYHLFHLSDRQKAAEIIRQVRQLEGVRQAEISEELTELKLQVERERLSSVMDRTVNICRKASDGCEVKYAFSPEDFIVH